MPVRVFISGIAGFIGSNLASYYLSHGFAVSGVDNLLGGSLANIPPGVEYRTLDCVEFAEYRDMIGDGDLVIHCAAAPYEGLSVFSPTLVYRHTLQSTIALLTAAISSRAKRFVLCSSMARYGVGHPPFREDHLPIPVDPYGWAKVGAEQAVVNLCEIYDMEWAIAVPHNVYGENQRFHDPFRNVVGIMANRMLQGKQPIIYGDGSQRRCFTYIADILQPIAKMGELTEACGEVINLGPDGGEVSILELAELIAGLIGFNIDPIFVPPRLREVPVANCSSQKARIILGYSPAWTLLEGLQRTIEYVRRVGPRPFHYHLPIEISSTRAPVVWMDRLL